MIPFLPQQCPQTAVAPQVPLTIGMILIYGMQMLGQTGSCSSSPPVHPPYLTFTLYFNSPAQNPVKKKKEKVVQWNYEEVAFPQSVQMWHNM